MVQATGARTDKPEAKKSATEKQRRSRPKRRRKQPKGDAGLVVQQSDTASMKVSPLDKDIFIYTYTLRPQSLLDNYQAGPSVVENMEYEDVA